jgi:hypothetical protein
MQQKPAGQGLFGNPQQTAQKPGGAGLFGAPQQAQSGGGLFGAPQQAQSGGGQQFGQTQQQVPQGGLFAGAQTGLATSQIGGSNPQGGGGLFGNPMQAQQQGQQQGTMGQGISTTNFFS